MKKIVLLAFAAIALLSAASCNKDNKNNDSSLVGVWINYRENTPTQGSEESKRVILTFGKTDFRMDLVAWVDFTPYVGTYTSTDNTINVNVSKVTVGGVPTDPQDHEKTLVFEYTMSDGTMTIKELFGLKNLVFVKQKTE